MDDMDGAEQLAAGTADAIQTCQECGGALPPPGPGGGRPRRWHRSLHPDQDWYPGKTCRDVAEAARQRVRAGDLDQAVLMFDRDAARVADAVRPLQATLAMVLSRLSSVQEATHTDLIAANERADAAQKARARAESLQAEAESAAALSRSTADDARRRASQVEKQAARDVQEADARAQVAAGRAAEADALRGRAEQRASQAEALAEEARARGERVAAQNAELIAQVRALEAAAAAGAAREASLVAELDRARVVAAEQAEKVVDAEVSLRVAEGQVRRLAADLDAAGRTVEQSQARAAEAQARLRLWEDDLVTGPLLGVVRASRPFVEARGGAGELPTGQMEVLAELSRAVESGVRSDLVSAKSALGRMEWSAGTFPETAEGRRLAAAFEAWAGAPPVRRRGQRIQ